MKEKKDNVRNSKKIINTIFSLVFLIIMIFSGTKIFNWFIENKKGKDILNDIQDAIVVEENSIAIDFESLKQKNPDTIAWIKVNGTNIDYPVVQTSNNDFYMTHSFDKTDNSAGWVFMDYKNKFDNTDKNTVIFAHNRRDGSLFGTLKNILTKEWQENANNHIIPIITENGKTEYQVFSVYRIEKEDYYIKTNFEDDNEFLQFIDKIKSRSEKDFNVDVLPNDNILTLSTCADNNKYRVVLHAKKIN